MSAKDDTKKHIRTVQKLLYQIIGMLEDRAAVHDHSKLASPEAEVFDEYTPKLRDTTYGSDEYKQFLKEMKPALDHHYANNPHHPEHHQHGVEDMTLVDLVEMLVDWKAATLRHDDGCIVKSIEINAKRFSLSPQLACILLNSVREFGWEGREGPEEMDEILRSFGYLVPKKNSGH